MDSTHSSSLHIGHTHTLKWRSANQKKQMKPHNHHLCYRVYANSCIYKCYISYDHEDIRENKPSSAWSMYSNIKEMREMCRDVLDLECLVDSSPSWCEHVSVFVLLKATFCKYHKYAKIWCVMKQRFIHGPNWVLRSKNGTVCEEVFVKYTPSSPSVVVALCKTVQDVSVHFLSSSAVGPDRDTE